MIKKTLLNLIKFYQKHISKHKGFTCAHLAHKGGVSCSEAISTIIKTNPYNKWATLSKARLKDCKSASKEIEKKRRRQTGRGCADLNRCCPHHCEDIFDACL
jgi:putative component of membrane protein insertase Oxa1/YidC/SpoIIIJ protein YidD